MENEILKELQEIKTLTLLGVKEALTTRDAALITGLSRSYIFKLTSRLKIPHYKSDGGKLTYFDKAELTAWMLQHRVKTAHEVESEAATYAVTGKHGRE